MNLALIAIGALLMALGLMLAASRAGYVYFVVGPRSVIMLAGAIVVAALALGMVHSPR